MCIWSDELEDGEEGDDQAGSQARTEENETGEEDEKTRLGSEAHEAALWKDRGHLPEARWKPYHPVIVQVRNSRAAQLHHKSTYLYPL